MDNPETNEWTIQRQRLTKQNAQHRKLKRFSNTDLTNKTRMNSCAQEVWQFLFLIGHLSCYSHIQDISQRSTSSWWRPSNYCSDDFNIGAT
jgi:hypothetical protein